MTEPRRIGRYEIIEELGRGGFAVVYRAHDTELDRGVALKVLHPYWTEDPGFAARFRREARAAARLRHPNIVTIYDAGEAEGQLYIAMEYLPGHTLREWLEAEGTRSLERALPILEQVAGALDYAHGQGIVHRDVKPSNIIVEEAERGVQATLMDFGLVKAMEGSAVLTSQGTLLGSPEYMAPEQADPERAAEIGPATDRYALGIVAYQMLTGRVPFPGNTPATLNAHEHKPVPPPRSLCPDLPDQVARALLKMLAKAPGDRFASARTFVARMRPPVEYARRRGPLGKLAAALVLFLLVVGAVYVALRIVNGDKATPMATPTSTAATSSIYSGLITYLSQDENGKSLHALSPDGTRVTLVQGVADVMILAVSPDRNYLAIPLSQKEELSRSTTYSRFIEGSGVSLVVVSADSREQTKVLSNVPLFDAAYTPDGRLVVAVLRDSMITYTVYQTDGKNPRELYRSHNVSATPETLEEVP